MKYFKNKNGEVFAYETQEERNQFGADDLVEMTADEIEAHLNPTLAPATVEEVERMRLVAYADPITGSDRFFAEAARLQAMGGTTDEIEAARAAGAARYAEIQGQYPWPA